MVFDVGLPGLRAFRNDMNIFVTQRTLRGAPPHARTSPSLAPSPPCDFTKPMVCMVRHCAAQLLAPPSRCCNRRAPPNACAFVACTARTASLQPQTRSSFCPAKCVCVSVCGRPRNFQRRNKKAASTMLTQGFLNDLLTSGATDLVGRLQVTSCPSITPTHLAFPPKQKNHEPRPTRAGYLIETDAVPQRPLPVDAVGWEPVYDWAITCLSR